VSKKNTSPLSHNDASYKEYVLEGLSKTLLASAFGLSRPTVQKYLAGVAPDGYRGGAGIYKLARVAPLLLKITGTRR